MKARISALSIRSPGSNDDAIVEFVVEIEDVRHLTRLVQGMRRVPGVRDVQRSQKL